MTKKSVNFILPVRRKINTRITYFPKIQRVEKSLRHFNIKMEELAQEMERRKGFMSGTKETMDLMRGDVK